ncbi:MAG: M48 family metalloprotease [Magnetococcus sp. YQC-5]
MADDIDHAKTSFGFKKLNIYFLFFLLFIFGSCTLVKTPLDRESIAIDNKKEIYKFYECVNLDGSVLNEVINKIYSIEKNIKDGSNIDLEIKYEFVSCNAPVIFANVDKSIIMDKRIVDLSEEEIEAIISHEMVHILKDHHFLRIDNNTFNYSVKTNLNVNTTFVDVGPAVEQYSAPFIIDNFYPKKYVELARKSLYKSFNTPFKNDKIDQKLGQDVITINNKVDGVGGIIERAINPLDELEADRLAIGFLKNAKKSCKSLSKAMLRISKFKDAILDYKTVVDRLESLKQRGCGGIDE